MSTTNKTVLLRDRKRRTAQAPHLVISEKKYLKINIFGTPPPEVTPGEKILGKKNWKFFFQDPPPK